MPHYFFHYRNASIKVVDKQGRDLADADDAWVEARVSARALARAYVETHGNVPRGSSLEVADSNDAILFELSLADFIPD